MSKIFAIAIVVFGLLLLGSAKPAQYCFTPEQFRKIERLKIRAIAYKAKNVRYQKTVEALLAELNKARAERLQQQIKTRRALRRIKPCSCTLPWIVTGLTAGACGAGMIAIGIIK